MIYIDPFGIPSTKEYDGGDGCAILSTLLALDPKPQWSQLIDRFVNPSLPTPVRHPNRVKWFGRPHRFSRDQLIPLLCALIVCRHKARGLWIDAHRAAEVLYKMHRRNRFLTAWNTIHNARYETPEEQKVMDPGTPWRPPKSPDLTLFEIWALWLRLRRQELPWWSRWPAYLLLNVLDIETLIGTIVWSFKSKQDRVTRNHMLVTITARRFWPTITSRINWEIADFGDWLKRWHDHCEAVGESNTAPHFDAVLKEMRR